MKLTSIKTKLILTFGVLLFFVCLGLGVISYVASTTALSDNIDKSLSQLAKEAAKVVHERVETQLNALEVLAENNIIKSNELSLEEKLAILEGEAKRSGHIRIGIADLEGNIIYTDGQSANISDRVHFQGPMKGERTVSDPIVSKINNNVIICYGVPIKDNDSIIGVLVAARDGNELSNIVADISFGESGYAFMINEKGTTIAFNDSEYVLNMFNAFDYVQDDPEWQSMVDLEKQMIEGKAGVGEYTFRGQTNYMGFAPVEGTKWSLAITAPKSEVMAHVDNLAMMIVVVSIIIFVVAMAITLLIATSISKPIKMASNYISVVASGDFTNEIPQRLLNMKDETGVLANSIYTMQNSIKSILKNVIEGSSDVREALISINDKMEQLNGNMEAISATTEELSASTEEIASSTEEMNATSSEIEKAAESIASKAQEGVVVASNVNDMAQDMKERVATSKEETLEIYGRTKFDLENAIEQSKAVNQINELSEAILDITSQTNLLALNAAIEAARAGEAGKGFAVVAEEIRKLAESSKSTVTRIQEVAKVILEAVDNLSSSSGEILEFIDHRVLKDYEHLAGASEKYSQSSFAISNIISDFSATSEELLASIQSMTKAIDEMANASNEGARGASHIAEDSSIVAQMSYNVMKLAESAKEKSDALEKAVLSFKI
ncbi:methyl-accepting chemotaxis protein [Lutispora thermophila]|uniref:Methyl-accepting chemotaxis sensory transducer with Cache sensor n=1 Tax=Lutispora thermophila DSM 19022 TaxID=1122184 RepID=A0A1M6J078_9FIRM|nr:methyl-accepting chemotaxis protein [Lutispora thermophila]SHJ40071.1 methyl-accepting chemotaxis sensory transducer with Cache sensor [Lutispora thermophila DSM 19022]